MGMKPKTLVDAALVFSDAVENLTSQLKARTAERDQAREDLAALRARVKVLEAALRGKVRRPYYTGRADGWWTCGECDAIGPEGQIKHRDGCAVAALAPTEEADRG